MNLDVLFSYLVKFTGWGLGVYVMVTGKLNSTEMLALIIAFVGFEVVTRAREKALPNLIEQHQRNGESKGDGGNKQGG